jgi:hypothetical protein
LIQEMPCARHVVPIFTRKARVQLRQTLRLRGPGIRGQHLLRANARLEDVFIVETIIKLQCRLPAHLRMAASMLQIRADGHADDAAGETDQCGYQIGVHDNALLPIQCPWVNAQLSPAAV